MSSTSKKEEDPKILFNNQIKSYLDNLYTVGEDSSLELEVRFGTRQIHTISKIDNANVVRVLLGFGFELEKETYMLRIQNEYMDAKTGQNKISNIRTEVSCLSNIHKYCQSDSIKELLNDRDAIRFVQKKYFKKGETTYYPVNQDDFNFRLSLQEEKKIPENNEVIQMLIRNWNDSKKIFRYIRRSSFTHKHLPFIVEISTVKSSHKERSYYIPENNIKASKVFESQESQELEIEVDNAMIGLETKYQSSVELAMELRKCIKYVLSGIQGSAFPISYTEQNDELMEYMRLVKDKSFKEGVRTIPRDFIGPSSLTLQMQNIISLQVVNESGSNIANIRKNYTVTDKADGERKLLYINKDGRIYMINTNMRLEFTGTYTDIDELFNSILDGEHILYNKHGETINLYAAFDIYFLAGKNITPLAFVASQMRAGAEEGEKGEKGEKEEKEKEKVDYRLPILYTVVKKLKPKCIIAKAGSNSCSFRIEAKKFYAETESQSIFQACSIIIQNIRDRLFEYETDGLIFTPMDTGVAQNRVGQKAPPFKTTWDASFKWKPPEFNTIDFLITINKSSNGIPIVQNIFTEGTNLNKETQLVSYQTLILRVGYDEKKHGYINPCQNIINAQLPSIEDRDNRDSYKPVQFFPTNPTDYNAGICNLILQKDSFGNDKIFTENGEIIEDNTIVEFKYNIDAEVFWRWTPIRIRHDKTTEYRAGQKNFGNAYHVANSNWHSIHNPITQEVISTGDDIPYQIGDDDIYYNKLTRSNLTRGLRDFHNLYVKNILINNVSKNGESLIDYAVGKGGDIPKWINAKLAFVLGLDLSRDNIENRLDGVCARYLNYHKKFRNIPRGLFLQGNTSVNIKNGDAVYTEKGKQIIKAVFGEGPKDEKFLGRGVYDAYGKARDGFNVSSIQFAIHYMFENILSLHNFLRNVSECTKVGGYFIGTSYDGETIFNKLKDKEIGESISIFRNDKKLWEIKKQYNASVFDDDVSSLGYAIDVYQESIDKTFREYLVNYNYLIHILESYGFVLLKPEEYKALNLPNSIGMFNQLFFMMNNDIKRNAKLKEAYGGAPNMTSKEKEISFINKYFVFKKIRDVDTEKVANLFINRSEEDNTSSINVLETEKAQKIVEELQSEADAKALSQSTQSSTEPRMTSVKKSKKKLKIVSESGS
jgi:hypothetical protein